MVSCQERSGGGSLQEADKAALICKILLIQFGTWECLVFEKQGYTVLPCVLMHELLSNLALAVLYMLMGFRQEKNTDVIQGLHQYFHNAPLEMEAAG